MELAYASRTYKCMGLHLTRTHPYPYVQSHNQLLFFKLIYLLTVFAMDTLG
jgi:hypothetical protein